jgi:hypothetical protein
MHTWRSKRTSSADGTTKPLVSQVSIGGVSAKIDLSVTPEEITTANFRLKNSPATSDALARELDRVTRSGGEIMLHFRLDHDSRLAQIGWLRSAYIIAFAALGYSYILQPTLDIVRCQIQDPGSSLIEDCYHGIRAEDEDSTRRIGYTQDPRNELDIVVVQMGKHVMFLPGFNLDVDVYAALSDMPKNTPLTRTLIELSWPQAPEYKLDFEEPRPFYPRLELRSRPPGGVRD